MTFEKLICRYCGKEYEWNRDLRSHERLCPKNPTRSRDMPEYDCPACIRTICGWKYNIIAHLKAHIRKSPKYIKKIAEKELKKYEERESSKVRSKSYQGERAI